MFSGYGYGGVGGMGYGEGGWGHGGPSGDSFGGVQGGYPGGNFYGPTYPGGQGSYAYNTGGWKYGYDPWQGPYTAPSPPQMAAPPPTGPPSQAGTMVSPEGYVAPSSAAPPSPTGPTFAEDYSTPGYAYTPGEPTLDTGNVAPMTPEQSLNQKAMENNEKFMNTLLKTGSVIMATAAMVKSMANTELTDAEQAIYNQQMAENIGPSAPSAYGGATPTNAGFIQAPGTQENKTLIPKATPQAVVPGVPSPTQIEETEKARRRRGFGSTLLTGPLGVQGPASVEQKTLFPL